MKNELKNATDSFLRLFSKKEEPKEGPAAAVIPSQGICDPHIHIFNVRAYLLATHYRGLGQPIFRMDDWRIYSSDDLVNRTPETTIHPEDTFLGKCEVGNTGGFSRFDVCSIALKNAAGTHGLCFVFRSEADEALRFEDFSIENAK